MITDRQTDRLTDRPTDRPTNIRPTDPRSTNRPSTNRPTDPEPHVLGVTLPLVVVVLVLGILWNWTDRPADRLASEAAKQPHDQPTGE